MIKKPTTVSASVGGALGTRSNSNVNTFPPMYPCSGGAPGAATATASVSNVMSSHHHLRQTDNKQSTTDLRLMMGTATAIGGEFSSIHSHRPGGAASTTARPATNGVEAKSTSQNIVDGVYTGALQQQQQNPSGGQRKSRNDTAEKERATQQRLPATFLDLAARGAELRGRRRSLSDLGIGAMGVKGASRLGELGVDKGKGSKDEDEGDEARELREVRQSVLDDDNRRRLSEDELTKKMARSKQRSSELYLEMFVCAQQRLQDIKRRQDAKRNLERRTLNADKWLDQLYPEEDEDDEDDEEFDDSVEELPPSDANHWNINYYTDVDGTARSWIEESDERACYERARQITVVQHENDDDDDDDDEEESQQQRRATTSPYAPLTDVALRRLRHTLIDRSNEHRVLADINGCEITGSCLRMLQPNRWLNDEVINAYTALVARRNEAARERVMNGGGKGAVIKQNGHGGGRYHVANGCGNGGGSAGGSNSSSAGNKENSRNNNGASNSNSHRKKKKKKERANAMSSMKKDKYLNNADDGVPLGNGNASATPFVPPRIKMMNSFFYSKLVQFDRRQDECIYRYANVRRWTRRDDVFSYDLMLIPINKHNVHWTLGVIDFRARVVMHLDSMQTGGDPNVCQNLLDWVRDEAAERGKYESHWQGKGWTAVERDVPTQGNTDDCGVFLCKFADFLARGWTDFGFEQKHMKYFRARIAHELLIGKAT